MQNEVGMIPGARQDDLANSSSRGPLRYASAEAQTEAFKPEGQGPEPSVGRPPSPLLATQAGPASRAALQHREQSCPRTQPRQGPEDQAHTKTPAHPSSQGGVHAIVMQSKASGAPRPPMLRPPITLRPLWFQ